MKLFILVRFFFSILCALGTAFGRLNTRPGGQIIEALQLREMRAEIVKFRKESALEYWMNYYSQKLPPLYG
jgi:hypothetical protein